MLRETWRTAYGVVSCRDRSETGLRHITAALPCRHRLGDEESYRPRGLVWGLLERLEDSGFADDIGLLSHAHKDTQETTDRVGKNARSVRHKMHSKSKAIS